MTHDISDLRRGDLVVREMTEAGRFERNIGEVVHIRARISYLDSDFPWKEWWDISTGTLHPFSPAMSKPYELRRATIEEIAKLQRSSGEGADHIFDPR